MSREELLKELTKIAERNHWIIRGRGDLEPRNIEDEDFFETSVWNLKAALLEAYELGRAAAKQENE